MTFLMSSAITNGLYLDFELPQKKSSNKIQILFKHNKVIQLIVEFTRCNIIIALSLKMLFEGSYDSCLA